MSAPLIMSMNPDLKALVARLGDDFEAGMSAAMLYTVEDVEGRTLDHVPVETSDLFNSITSYVSHDLDGAITGVVKTTAEHGIYVHNGTGIFGPKKKKIVPKDKKALFWPGAEYPVKSVKGMKPRPFFTKAVEEKDPADSLAEGLGSYLMRRGW